MNLPEAKIVVDGTNGPLSVSNEDPDPASSDTTSFGTDGSKARIKSREKKDTLTTTASVKCDDTDKTKGSGPGVDDHTAKLPLLGESAVRATVYTNRHERSILKLEDAGDKREITETSGSKSDGKVRCVPADDMEPVSINKEPDPSHPSVVSLDMAHSKEKSPDETRYHDLTGEILITMAYAN